MDQDRPLDYEYYVSDAEMEVDSTSRADRTESRLSYIDSDTSSRQSIEGSRRRRKVRFLTQSSTQTDAFLLLGRSVCITGPAVDQYILNKTEVDKQNGLLKSLLRQIERSQKKMAQLEKEIIQKQIEVTTYKMQTTSLQTTVAINESIIEEFASKIRMTTEELTRKRLEGDRDYLVDP